MSKKKQRNKISAEEARRRWLQSQNTRSSHGSSPNRTLKDEIDTWMNAGGSVSWWEPDKPKNDDGEMLLGPKDVVKLTQALKKQVTSNNELVSSVASLIDGLATQHRVALRALDECGSANRHMARLLDFYIEDKETAEKKVAILERRIREMQHLL